MIHCYSSRNYNDALEPRQTLSGDSLSRLLKLAHSIRRQRQANSPSVYLNCAKTSAADLWALASLASRAQRRTHKGKKSNYLARPSVGR